MHQQMSTSNNLIDYLVSWTCPQLYLEYFYYPWFDLYRFNIHKTF